jgi:hypothetical protein
VADEKVPGTEGEYEFKLPDFDEDTFIHREIVSFKTTAILIGWAVVAAAASWALYASLNGNQVTGWLGGLALCGAFGLGLRWLFPRLGADVAHFKRREWFGTASMFFMAWLAFFIVAINPPVSDFSAPHLELSVDPPVQAPGGLVTIHVLATDNAKAEAPSLSVLRDGAAVPVQLQPTERDGHYEARLDAAAAGEYVVRATAQDRRHATAANLTFTVGGAAFTLETRGRLELSGDSIVATLDAAPSPALHACTQDDLARAHPCLRAVRLVHADGKGAITMEPKEGRWTADSSHAGWRKGNNTVHVEAEFLNHYMGARQIDGGVFRSSQEHTINVTAPLGSKEVAVANDPVARPVNVPAPAGLLAALVVLGAAAIARRRSQRFSGA